MYLDHVVVVEKKPFVATSAEADRLIALAKRYGEDFDRVPQLIDKPITFFSSSFFPLPLWDRLLVLMWIEHNY